MRTDRSDTHLLKVIYYYAWRMQKSGEKQQRRVHKYAVYMGTYVCAVYMYVYVPGYVYVLCLAAVQIVCVKLPLQHVCRLSLSFAHSPLCRPVCVDC